MPHAISLDTVKRWKKVDHESNAEDRLGHAKDGSLLRDANGDLQWVGEIDHAAAVRDNALGLLEAVVAPAKALCSWVEGGWKNGGLVGAIVLGGAGITHAAVMTVV